MSSLVIVASVALVVCAISARGPASRQGGFFLENGTLCGSRDLIHAEVH